jgi:hypothetical protein
MSYFDECISKIVSTHLKGKYVHPAEYGMQAKDALISVKSPLQKEIIKAEGKVEQKPLNTSK